MHDEDKMEPEKPLDYSRTEWNDFREALGNIQSEPTL